MKEIVSPPLQRTCLKLGLPVAVGDVGSPGRGAGGAAGSGAIPSCLGPDQRPPPLRHRAASRRGAAADRSGLLRRAQLVSDDEPRSQHHGNLVGRGWAWVTGAPWSPHVPRPVQGDLAPLSTEPACRRLCSSKGELSGPCGPGVGVPLKQVLWTGVDHEEHGYLMNLSERESAACEPRSRCLLCAARVHTHRHSLDLSDAGLPGTCSCQCRKRPDGDQPAQEALGSSSREGPPTTFQPEPPGPGFPRGMVPGPREGGQRCALEKIHPRCARLSFSCQ
ncbi:uncharacterized protein [Odocoileus virginianus]|uniref:Uncharacterized protein isoform X2 n=1 Tax=Odocoileus virginianus TaxID=9874 RepID=A0ABM4J181_ODOVR